MKIALTHHVKAKCGSQSTHNLMDYPHNSNKNQLPRRLINIPEILGCNFKLHTLLNIGNITRTVHIIFYCTYIPQEGYATQHQMQCLAFLGVIVSHFVLFPLDILAPKSLHGLFHVSVFQLNFYFQRMLA